MIAGSCWRSLLTKRRRRIHVNDKRLVTRRGRQGVVARCTWKTLRRFDSKSWLVKYENRKTTPGERKRFFLLYSRSSETLEGGAEIRGEEGEEETVLECFFLVFLERLSNGFLGIVRVNCGEGWCVLSTCCSKNLDIYTTGTLCIGYVVLRKTLLRVFEVCQRREIAIL